MNTKALLLTLSLVISSCGANLVTPSSSAKADPGSGLATAIPLEVESFPDQEEAQAPFPVEVIAPPVEEARRFVADPFIQLLPPVRVNRFGNPIYQLQVVANGVVVASFDAVSGRAHTQNRNRHKSGTEAPLPTGTYKVAPAPIASSTHEVGGKFLYVYPEFPTGRTELGIHVDPSFERSKKEDGTAGCIALTSVGDRDSFYRLVAKYGARKLYVKQ